MSRRGLGGGLGKCFKDYRMEYDVKLKPTKQIVMRGMFVAYFLAVGQFG